MGCWTRLSAGASLSRSPHRAEPSRLHRLRRDRLLRMAIRAGVLSSAHLHAGSFVSCLKNTDAEVAGLWDDNPERGRAFADRLGLPFFEDRDALLGQIDAAVICSENMKHADHIEAAVNA